ELAGHRLRGAGNPLRLGERLIRTEQGLRGHARVEGALAADEVALDDRDRQPVLGEPPRADLAGRAGADDDPVELVAHPAAYPGPRAGCSSRSDDEPGRFQSYGPVRDDGGRHQVTESSLPASQAEAAEPPLAAARKLIAPLALAQFICSFAGSNMNVMISDITDDLDTTVKGVQTTITLFLVIMAILMIPCSKLTDRWGRKRCFLLGLILYGIGALLCAVAPGLGVLILGNSVLEGVGTALLIPPVYILTTMGFSDLASRARAFGLISGMGGVGAAAGPLIGGVITTAIRWRAAFVFQALVVATIVLLSRRITDPVAPDPTRPFDTFGAVLSAVGMFFVVFGILQAG